MLLGGPGYLLHGDGVMGVARGTLGGRDTHMEVAVGG